MGSVAQSCPTLCGHVDCNPPGSSVHGMSQARILEFWSGLPFHTPGDLLNPAIEPSSLVSPTLVGGFFTPAPPGKHYAQ